MPTNLLVLPLLGGFCFVHILYFLRFRAQRLEGYRLLIECAIAGAGLLFTARLLISCFNNIAPPPVWVFGYQIQRHWQQFWSLEDAGTAALSLFLGVFLPLMVNCVYRKKRAKEAALEGHHSAMIRLLHYANSRKQAIAVTMDNRKWYAGLVLDSPNLDPQESHFRLLPFLSGFRNSENLKVEITTYYKFPEDEQVTKPDLAVTLPLADVKVANLFDEDIFFDVFKNERSVTESMDTVNVQTTTEDTPSTDAYLG